MSETITLENQPFVDVDKKKAAGKVTIVLNVKVIKAATATAAPNQIDDKNKAAAPVVAPVVTPAISVDARPKTPVLPSTISRSDQVEISISRIDTQDLPNVEKATGFLGIPSQGILDKNDVYVKLKLGPNGKELTTETRQNAGAKASFDYVNDKNDKKLAETMKWVTTMGELATSKLSWSVWDWNDPKSKDKRADVRIGSSAEVALALKQIREGGTEMSETITLENQPFVDVDKKKAAGKVTIVLNVKVVKAATAAPNQIDDKNKAVPTAVVSSTGTIKPSVDHHTAAAPATHNTGHAPKEETKAVRPLIPGALLDKIRFRISDLGERNMSLWGMFEAADLAGQTGFVSRKDFEAVLKRMGFRLLEKELDDMVLDIDEDGNGDDNGLNDTMMSEDIHVIGPARLDKEQERRDSFERSKQEIAAYARAKALAEENATTLAGKPNAHETKMVSEETKPMVVTASDRVEIRICRIDTKELPNVEKATGFLGIPSQGILDKNDVYVKLKLGPNGKELTTETRQNAGAKASFDYVNDKNDKKLAETMKWVTTVGELATSKLSWSVWDWNDPKSKDKRADVRIGSSAEVALALKQIREGGTEMSETITLENQPFVDEDKKKAAGKVTIVLNVKVIKAAATTTAAPNQSDDKNKAVATTVVTNTGIIKPSIDHRAAAAPLPSTSSKITATSTSHDKNQLDQNAKAGGGGEKLGKKTNDGPPNELSIQPQPQLKEVEDIYTAELTLRTNLQSDQDKATASELLAKFQTMDMKRHGYVKRDQFNFVISQIPTIKLSQLEAHACMDYFDHIGDGSQIDYQAFTKFCAYRTPTMIPAWTLLQSIPFGPTAISTMRYVISSLFTLNYTFSLTALYI